MCIRDRQRAVFERNGWDIVEAAQPAHTEPPPLCYSSVWLCMNVLVLNPETVIVEASEKNMIAQIKSFGMNVIDLPFRDCLLYTSDAADDLLCVDLGGCRIIKKKKIR
eukprot:TRINITY_DN966_c0_g1_i2.p2 TRINITY_DN966_c0_g1~~TRINITY_DN966_c0_g1_i2.p2  ORF type:complete len:108 (+),score=61.02 TRINITY_DN966_c0_g1_i2:119-442(+)